MSRPAFTGAELAEVLDLRKLLLRQAGSIGRQPPLFTRVEQIELKRLLEPILKAAIARANKRRATCFRSAPGRQAVGAAPCRLIDVIAALAGCSASTLMRTEAFVAEAKSDLRRVHYIATWKPERRDRRSVIVKELLERAEKG